MTSSDKLREWMDDLESMPKEEKMKIFNAAADAFEILMRNNDGAVDRAVLTSAVAYLAAGLVRKSSCCAYHATEVWTDVGNVVIAHCMPGDEPEWEEKYPDSFEPPKEIH